VDAEAWAQVDAEAWARAEAWAQVDAEAWAWAQAGVGLGAGGQVGWRGSGGSGRRRPTRRHGRPADRRWDP